MPKNIGVPEEEKEEIFREHLRGDSFSKIGRRHYMNQANAYYIFTKKATQAVDQLEMELLAARKTGEAVGFAVPFQEEGAWQDALDLFQYLVRRLADRGVSIAVEYRATDNGIVLFLSDTTDYGGSE